MAEETKAKPDSSRKAEGPAVLIADDNVELRRGLARALSLRGWRAHTCGDGLSALQILSEYCLDAVIADLHMPGMSGPRLLEYVKGVCPDTVLVMLSGWPAAWAVEHANRIGATVFTKPFEFEELLGVLNAGRSKAP